jgi:hypothetical protein
MWRKKMRALLACLGLVTLLVAASPAQAQAITHQGGAVGATTSRASQSAAQMRVCAPKKCITVMTTQYCARSKPGCVKGEWIPWNQYCSSSYGCVTIDGKNYIWSGSSMPKGKVPTSCTVGLGFSMAAFYAGPGGWAAAGVLISAWGCAG